MKEKMFGAPERRTNGADAYFYVAVTAPIALDVKATMPSQGVVTPDLAFQDNFRELQDRILSELLKNRQLFKNPPSLESLQAITPNWGCIVKGGELKWNTTMSFTFPESAADRFPALADFLLTGLTITRSTIAPVFTMKWLEKIGTEPVIDFEWPAAAAPGKKRAAADLEEVSDIASAAAEGSLTLRNPAQIRKEMLESKEKVRNAFMSAEQARLKAEELARVFYATYDVSDDESTFTEWMDSEDEED